MNGDRWWKRAIIVLLVPVLIVPLCVALILWVVAFLLWAVIGPPIAYIVTGRMFEPSLLDCWWPEKKP